MDARPVVGAIVVFLIIGLVAFGVYYFFISKPATDALATSKSIAMSQITSLGAIGTQQAISDTATYSTRVQAASSQVEVDSIVVEVNASILREHTRKELLAIVATATDGTYYSAVGESGKTPASALADLQITLTDAVNSQATKADLDAYRAEIDSKANLTWRNLLNAEISNLGENVAMFKNSPVSGAYMTKTEARNYIAGLGWEAMRQLKFERYGTVEVPVLDTFQRTPTIKAGSMVNIYVFNTENQVMENLWLNARIRNVIYSQSDVAGIVWTLTSLGATQSFSVDIWETIKAVAAGSSDASGVDWSGYGADVMERALEANIGLFPMSVIYMVEVPDEIGRLIVQYEFQMSAARDVILVAKV
ncbi:MAG: hypothetical protein ABH852_04790 [Methanobacteriota archaeon]